MGKKFFYGWVIVFTLMGISAMAAGSRFTFSVVMKPLTEQFGWSRSSLSAVVSLSLILVSLLQVGIGWLVDRFSPRWLATMGFVTAIVSLYSMSFVSELWHVYVLYGLVGAVSFALVSPVVSTSLVNRWFHAHNRGMALSLAASGVAIGQLSITPLAERLMVLGGWQLSYRALATFMTLVMLPCVLILLRDPPKHEATAAQAQKNIEDTARVSLWQAMHTATFWQLLMGVFACGFTMSFANVHFHAHATDIGMDSHFAADALGLSGAFSIMGAVLMGKWSDRSGRRVPLGTAYALRSLSFVVLFFTNSEWMMFLFAVILGLSWTATTPLSSAVTVETWGKNSAGFLFGLIFPFMQVGSAVGAYLAGLNHDISNNYALAIIANASVAALGALASFTIREDRKTKGDTSAIPLPQAMPSAGR